jgi:hypothetical protein
VDEDKYNLHEQWAEAVLALMVNLADLFSEVI